MRGTSASARNDSPESPDIPVNRRGSLPDASAQTASGDAVNITASLEEVEDVDAEVDANEQNEAVKAQPASPGTKRQITQKQRRFGGKKKGKVGK